MNLNLVNMSGPIVNHMGMTKKEKITRILLSTVQSLVHGELLMHLSYNCMYVGFFVQKKRNK